MGVAKHFSHAPIRDGDEEGRKSGAASNVVVSSAFKDHVKFILCLTTCAAWACAVSDIYNNCR